MNDLWTELDQEKSLSADLKLACIRRGKACYDEVAFMVTSGSLSDRQLINAIWLLFELATDTAFGRKADLVDLLSKLVAHENTKVRSEAVAGVIGLATMSIQFPRFDISPMSKEIVASRIRKVVDKGFEFRHESQRVKFLKFLAENA